MSVARTIGTGIGWNTLSIILGKGLIFANIFLILRFLSVYDYGLSELVFSVVSLVSVALLPGLTSAIIADLGVERGRGDFCAMKGIFLQHFFIIAVLGVGAWAALFICGPLVATLVGNPSIGYFLRIVSFLFLTSPLRTASIILANVELRFRDQAFFSVVEEAVKCVFLVIAVVLLGWGIKGLLYAAVLSQVGVILLYAPRTLSAYRVFSHAQARNAGQLWRVLLDHRKWSIATSYTGTILQNFQLWVIRAILGTEAVGLFAFATGIFSHVLSLLPLSTVLAPVLPRHTGDTVMFRRLVRTALKAQFVLSIPLFAAALAAAPLFVLIFPKYAPALPLLVWLLFGTVPNAVSMIFTPAFMALKEQYSLFVSTIIKLFLTVLLFPLCAMLLGTLGMAAAIVAVIVLSTLERYARLGRLVHGLSFGFRELFSATPEERAFIRMLYRAAMRRILPGGTL